MRRDHRSCRLFTDEPLCAKRCVEPSEGLTRLRTEPGRFAVPSLTLSNRETAVMTMRAELPFTMIRAGGMREPAASLWNRIAALARDADFLAVCAVSAAGLVATIGFALAVVAASRPIELSVQAFVG